MRKLLAIITLALLSNPVISADLKIGDVLYCTSDFFYGTNVNNITEVKRYNVENFKLSISQNSVDFGSSGYFSNTSMPTREIKMWSVIAQDEHSTFGIDAHENDIYFNYASANPFGMAMMKGSCDKF